MHHKLAALAVFAGLLAAGQAHATDRTGWFVSGNIGNADYDVTADWVRNGDTDQDMSYAFMAGFRTQIIGVEAGYVDLGTIASDQAGVGGAIAGHSKLSATAWAFGLNTRFNPTDMWYLSAHGGVLVWNLDGEVGVDSAVAAWHRAGDQGSANWYAGVGTGLDLTREWSIGLYVDYYRMSDDRFAGQDTGDYQIDTTIYGVNTEFRF